jgi:hypothetical protein
VLNFDYSTFGLPSGAFGWSKCEKKFGGGFGCVGRSSTFDLGCRCGGEVGFGVSVRSHLSSWNASVRYQLLSQVHVDGVKCEAK